MKLAIAKLADRLNAHGLCKSHEMSGSPLVSSLSFDDEARTRGLVGPVHSPVSGKYLLAIIAVPARVGDPSNSATFEVLAKPNALGAQLFHQNSLLVHAQRYTNTHDFVTFEGVGFLRGFFDLVDRRGCGLYAACKLSPTRTPSQFSAEKAPHLTESHSLSDQAASWRLAYLAIAICKQ